jgi:hypothetical protein
MTRYFNLAGRLGSCIRYAGALGALTACIFGAALAGQVGLSRLLSEYGSTADSLTAAEQALRFNAADPEAHYAHAVRLAEVGRANEGIAEFERAVSLRPKDYFLWQELARARDDNGDDKGAITALRQAIRLAPYYSQPHWQLGNVLLRGDQLDAAFQELRSAVASDPALFPAFIDLAWGVYDRDAKTVLAVTQPESEVERIELARFFVNHDQVKEGMDLVLAVGAKLPAEDRRALIAALIAQRQFSQAHELWLAGADASDAQQGLFDGGFETSISSDEQGFRWKPTKTTQAVYITLDSNGPNSGNQSLRLDYAGNSDPATPIISQLILVARDSWYRLSFAARTQDLVSGGMPVVVVVDAASNRRLIAQSPPLCRGTTGWRDFSIDFKTANTTAVTINIQRQFCSSQPCPMFGRAWFDSFSLRRL